MNKADGTVGLYALMDRYIDGDRRAFGKLYDILGPRLRGFLIRLVRDEAVVDDLVQLTLLKAHLARARFVLHGGDPDGAVQGWYFAICRNVAMDHLRDRYRHKGRTTALTVDSEESEIADDGPDAEQFGQAVERETEIVERVRRAIARLPPGQREVVELHKLQGMSMAEIAERLRIREGAVRVRAHRAYKALARLLGRGTIDVIILSFILSFIRGFIASLPGATTAPHVARLDACGEPPAAPPPCTAPARRSDASHTEGASCRRA